MRLKGTVGRSVAADVEGSEGELSTAALPSGLADNAPLERQAAPNDDDDDDSAPERALPPVDGDEKLAESCAPKARGKTTPCESELPAPEMPDSCERASTDDGGGEEKVARISESRVAHSDEEPTPTLPTRAAPVESRLLSQEQWGEAP